MHIVFAIGRILIVVLFIMHGAGKLIDISGVAEGIAGKVPVPAPLGDIATQVQNATGMSTDKLIVAAAGAIELVGGLLLAFGIGTRPVALVLTVYTILVTYYLHNFWGISGQEQGLNLMVAEKNLVVIGGLLVLFAIGRWYVPWRKVE